ncbi:MarC family protein [Alicyclobacillus tolerans]|uniref:MarC family protein n=1 Tax=Alicyclobacillus tolerans TaxID=90970 RepID=UPI001F3BF254|nr:NAAT family transporter [Alicyclobacillus tolerans]MCF8566750.1 MarC family protein [Alicyclobacillus tolerans]
MVAYFIHSLISIFAVMNPLGIMPTFLALTSGYSADEQRHTARKAVVNSFFILLAFLIFGSVILNLFSITINAFRVAGGILLFGIAYDLLHAKPSPIQSTEGEEKKSEQDISVTPLAIPIVAGPGTITTVMALAAGPGSIIRTSLVVFLAFVVVLAAAFAIFYYAPWINSRLSESQLNVITRLMGFLLSIIAVQMAANGLGGLFPGWLR